jgi:hypothetical protein
MAEIKGARRSLFQAVYTPLQLDEPAKRPNRALDKWNFFATSTAGTAIHSLTFTSPIPARCLLSAPARSRQIPGSFIFLHRL